MCQTFAGREIGDGNGSNPGSNPVTVSAIIDAPAKLTFPQSSPVFSEPRTSYWIGYTGSYPSSDANLAQGGIVDYLYTPSGGGTYKRHSLSLFVQYAPDPIAYLEDNIQFGDKVYVSVQYVSDTSATVSFMDMTHQISDAMTITLMDRSACPPPPNGNGICNNGDNAMWMFEDHGDVAVMDYQDPPTTANFGKIFFDSPQAVYTNGDINVPNDANCHPFSATCGVYLTQFNLVPPNPPSGFSVTPGFLNANGGSMTIPYSGPSSGFNFPP